MFNGYIILDIIKLSEGTSKCFETWYPSPGFTHFYHFYMVFFLAQKRVDKPGEELVLDHRQQNHDPGRWLKKKAPCGARNVTFRGSFRGRHRKWWSNQQRYGDFMGFMARVLQICRGDFLIKVASGVAIEQTAIIAVPMARIQKSNSSPTVGRLAKSQSCVPGLNNQPTSVTERGPPYQAMI